MGKQRGFGFSGFSIAPRQVGPDALPGFGAGSGGRSAPLQYGKKRVKNEEDYFDDDEEAANLEYMPAPGSPSRDKLGADDGEESDDPLDSFMAEIEHEVRQQEKKPDKPSKADKKGVRADIENEDVQESYYRYMEENPMAGVILEEDEQLEYDVDGNVILPNRKMIDPLPPVDHSDIDYIKFNKNFYEEAEDIRALNYIQVQELREKLGIRVSGIDLPKPVSSFAHFGFGEKLIKAVQKAGYEQPMPIQAQGVPVALSGRDIIGIAKTGSGKTAAFLWPLLIHIMDQKELQPGDGPIGLICAPTRELSQQIYQEAKKFGKVFNINVVCAYGGGSMYEQCKACEEGAEIIVCTPGRLIDLVKKKATKLNRVTYLVLDEADRMFDMGFEPQVRSIANHIRPDRQTLLFSATFRRRIERLARDILRDPIRVVQGDIGEANEDVTQVVLVMAPAPSKWQWLLSRLVEFTTIGTVLIFVTRKANSEELATNLTNKDFKVGLMHGDMSQTERNEVIHAFKKKEMPILVATDVAARGLDIPHIRTVVNFDVARDIDTHTHRIGRTGRAGTKGTAYTLITTKDKDFAGHLVRNLEGANQDVPSALMDLAQQNPWFKKSRYRQQKAKKLSMTGFRERPGLGSGTSSGGSKTTASLSEPANFAAWEPNKAVGPQSDRVSALKAAFSSQFRHSFTSASAETSWKGSTGTQEYTNPEVEKPDYGSGSIQHAHLTGLEGKVAPTHMAIHAAQNAAHVVTYDMPPAPGGSGLTPFPVVPPPVIDLEDKPPPGYNEETGRIEEQPEVKRKRRSRWE